MLPLTGIPPLLKPHLEFFRRCFERHDTYDHFAEYVTGLIAGTNTTVAGIARASSTVATRARRGVS